MPVARRSRNRRTAYDGCVNESTDAEIGLVLAFLNSVDVEAGTDEFRDPATYAAWLRERGLPTGHPNADLAAARRLRAGLRAAAGDPDSGPEPLTVPVRVALDGSGRPAVVATDALGAIAAAAVALAGDGRWDRLKICPADDCRWAFYDRSKNRSRHWCSMAECGGRAKSRAFRARKRTP
jgi:CGNR zinc finger/Putative stress-induced transcription regulator